MMNAVLMLHHPAWQPGQAEMAAAGGADRSSAKNAATPINQSREAHAPLGAAAPLPRGGHALAGTFDPAPRIGASETARRSQGIATEQAKFQGSSR
jgi:hypothetical protein